MRAAMMTMTMLILAGGGWHIATAAQTASTQAAVATAEPPPRLSAEARSKAASQYQQYCALCHGADRAGHANDEAPSLRTRSIWQSATSIAVVDAIRYGRPGTAMGGYLEDVGGPLSRDDIRALINWLREESGSTPADAPPPLPRLPQGEVTHGAVLYAQHCASCHGDKGQGGLGTALRNPTMLALTPDGFLHEAIAFGRKDTPMQTYGKILSDHDIASLLAWLRAGDGKAQARKQVLDAPPPPSQWVLNPDGKAPEFQLKNDLYVDAAQLRRVLDTKPRIVLLDTRVMSMWQTGHIAGAVPMPYYSSREDVIRDMPRDGTWIVAYCECPRAAAESVVKKLREQGFKNTAVLYEGIGGWVTAGYPVISGTLDNAPPHRLIDNGKGLANFEVVGAANWRESEGVLQADARTGEGSGFLVTRKVYGDFEVTLEFWASDDANSGIYMRCADGKAPTDKTCYEANIFDQRPDPSYGTGAIVHVAKVAPGAHRAGGHWNTYRVRLVGDHLQVWFNDVQTVDARDGTLTNGPIALQYNAGMLKVRNFQVRPL